MEIPIRDDRLLLRLNPQKKRGSHRAFLIFFHTLLKFSRITKLDALLVIGTVGVSRLPVLTIEID